MPILGVIFTPTGYGCFNGSFCEHQSREITPIPQLSLAVEIGPDGRVASVSIRKKHASALLNRAALKAAEPLEGRPTKLTKAVTIVVPVRFELR